MGELFGAVLGLLVVVSFVVIGFYLTAGVAASVATMARARRDRQLMDELDGVLEEVLGPRTSPSRKFPSPPRVRRN